MLQTELDIGRLFQSPGFWIITALVLIVLNVPLYLALSRSGNFEDSVYRIDVISRVKGQAFVGHGTGFLVSKDRRFLVTNHHVIEGAIKIEVNYQRDNEILSLPAKIMWSNRVQDLAILETRQPLQGTPVTLADISENLSIKRQSVTAVGFPGIVSKIAEGLTEDDFNPKRDKLTALDPTMSVGTVQRVIPTFSRLLIQHSANIHGGNSGGPLYDSCGRVIGVNTLSAVTKVTQKDLYDLIVENKTAVGITAPGSLEFSVHSKDVIGALDKEQVSYLSAAGYCRLGLARAGQVTMGVSTLMSIAAFLIAGIGIYQGPTGFAETYTQFVRRSKPDTVMAMGSEKKRWSNFELKPIGGGASIDPSIISALLSGEEINVGRSTADNDVAIADDSISRQHAVLKMDDADVTLRDLNSTNGTLLNGKRVGSSHSEILSNGDKILFGQVEYRVKLGSRNDASSSGSKWMLSGFDRGGRVVQFDFSAPLTPKSTAKDFIEICSVGRSSTNDLSIDDSSVSRTHAIIGCIPGKGVAIKDARSSNGTYVDGKKVGSHIASLTKAKTVKFGEVTLSLSKVY